MSATAPTLDLTPNGVIKSSIPPPMPLVGMEDDIDLGIIIELDFPDFESVETPLMVARGNRIFDEQQRRYLTPGDKHELTEETYYKTFFGDDYKSYM